MSKVPCHVQKPFIQLVGLCFCLGCSVFTERKNLQEKCYLVLFLIVCSLAAAHQKILNEHKWLPNLVIYSEKEKTYQMLKHYRENQMVNK